MISAMLKKWKEYFLLLLSIIFITLINLFLRKHVSYLSIGLIYLAAVSIISPFFTRRPVLLFSGLSAILWNFLFIPPRYTIMIGRLEDLFMFLMYFISAIITGHLTSQLKTNEIFLRNKETKLQELYRLSGILNETNSLEDIIQKACAYLRKAFSVRISIFLADENSSILQTPFPGGDFQITGDECVYLKRCFNKQLTCGKYIDTSQAAKNYYIPLKSQDKVFGVMAVDYLNSFNCSAEHAGQLAVLAGQIATAIGRNELTRIRQKVQIAEESEKLYQILLNSVSHELRTPITSISTAAAAFIDKNLFKNYQTRQILALDIIEAAERLNRLVDNLLGTLRIESGKIKLNLEWYDINELAAVVRKKIDKFAARHRFIVKISKKMPLLKFDFFLMEQLLSNLLHNAVLYTPPKSKICLQIINLPSAVEIAVSDNGPGIPEKDHGKIFEKFYRASGAKTGGLGLGLSICREIAEIHRGTICVANKPAGGCIFTVRLPLKKSGIRGKLR
ncbi:MAG: hypothetical protein A2096_16855 [Spirochaetes bacterium GWF1_41_5]|nr:MAG: hypothetical protein A2096_16855 [Spirochaetes bacterium GWF1_41_5]HBE02431.1 hypothetical protein [Spirochaetia bacterium]